ncbi:MAG: hypothetical protein ACKVOB_00555 [Sphingomonas sp.]
MRAVSVRLAVALLTLSLGACSRGDDTARDLNALDAELADTNTAAVRDPALASALHDQIMVDPALVGQANLDAVRPPAKPYAAPTVADTPVTASADAGAATQGIATSRTISPAPAPKADCPQCGTRRDALTLRGLAARQSDRPTRNCAAGVGYSTRWAQNLPKAFPLYSDARVSEAAANMAGGCALRIVSFASAAAPQTMIDFYYASARRAGFSPDHRADGDDHVVTGTRGTASVIIFVSPRDDRGSDVDLVLSNVN